MNQQSEPAFVTCRTCNLDTPIEWGLDDEGLCRDCHLIGVPGDRKKRFSAWEKHQHRG